MKTLTHQFPTLMVAITLSTMIFAQTAVAQDASQIAAQNAQQASQQATAQAQQAMQQAAQQNQQMVQQTSIASSATAQRQPAPAPEFPLGPIPRQIADAHKVFLTNAGASHNFPVDENTAYNDVLIAFQSWGHYQFVSSPGDADLIFSLHDAAPITDISGDADSTYSVTSPAFILTIVDAHTNTPLWTVTSPVISYGSGKKEAQWFALSVSNLITRVKVLAGQPLTLQEQANLTTFPKSHRALAIAIVLGSVTGFAVAGVLIGEHLSNNWAANAKAQQDAFCKANNIPLSMCAGG